MFANVHMLTLQPDAAFLSLCCCTGLTLARLLADIVTLRRVVTYHLLPNVPVLDAYWTTPFLLPGTILSTLLVVLPDACCR